MEHQNDYVNERAGRFFNALARAKKVNTVVRTPVRQDIPVGFVRSLRVALPALVLVTSANAQTNTPQMTLQVNDQELEQLESVGPQVEKAIEFAARAAEQLPELMQCAQSFYQEQPKYNAQAGALLMEYRYEAMTAYAQILQWAKTYGRDVKLGVAAFCQNPRDWQGVVMKWDNNVERYENSALPNQAATYVLSRRAARADTVYAAVEHAAWAQQQSLQNGLLHKVDGFDWARAAASLAAGASALLGKKELGDVFRDSERQARNAGNVYSQAQRANQRQGAQRFENIGRVMEQAARMGRINAPRPRPTY